MAVSPATKTPLALCLGIFGLALLGVCAYLAWLTSSQHNDYTSVSLYTCFITGDASNVVVGEDKGTLVVYADYNVTITSSDSSNGVSGVCNLETSCTSSTYILDVLTCTSWVQPLPILSCWQSASTSAPVCVQPGSSWLAALAGCIVTGVCGVVFLLFAWCVQRRNRIVASSTPVVATGEFVSHRGPVPNHLE